MCNSGLCYMSYGTLVYIDRVPHGYGKTRGFSKTGNAGTGTVVDFGIPRHTATRTRGIAGMHRFIVIG